MAGLQQRRCLLCTPFETCDFHERLAEETQALVAELAASEQELLDEADREARQLEEWSA